MDIIFNHERSSGFVKEHGWDEFLGLLREEYPDYDLYSISTLWLDDSQYICKAKGVNGDLVIGWEERIEQY